MMVSKFAVFGSCGCRDIFNHNINPNYKDFFKILGDGTHHSFISIMQQPINYNLQMISENERNELRSYWIKKDLNKEFLSFIKDNEIDYLMIDTYYDAVEGVLEINNGSNYVSMNEGIENTNFYNNLENKRILKFKDNPKEYFEIWSKNCDLFFDFLKENCPNTKVILNPTRDVFNYIDSNGELAESKNFKDNFNFNIYRCILDYYICNNFDVEVLTFYDDTLASKNHPWGFSSRHYSTEYYQKVTNQINDIIKYDVYLKDYEDLNNEFRFLKRKNALLSFNQEIFSSVDDIDLIKKLYYEIDFFNNFINEDVFLNDKETFILMNKINSFKSSLFKKFENNVLFRDFGIKNDFNDNWFNSFYFIRDSNYSTICNKEDSVLITYPIINNNSYFLPNNFSLLFTLINFKDVILRFLNNECLFFDFDLNDFNIKGITFLKITYDSNTLNLYLNNKCVKSIVFDLQPKNSRFQFRIAPFGSIKFSNFEVYDNGD